MANKFLIMGEPGSGKSSTFRNADPETTLYIDCDCKGLNYKGWRKDYCAENKNYIKTDDVEDVKKYLRCAANGNKYNLVVIDTINALMIAHERKYRASKGYDKWVDLADCIWDLLVMPDGMRDDLTVAFVAHSQTVTDDDGYRITKVLTSGSKLGKLKPESRFNWVFLAVIHEDGTRKLVFNMPNTTSRVPFGGFEGVKEIDNDVRVILDEMKEF